MKRRYLALIATIAVALMIGPSAGAAERGAELGGTKAVQKGDWKSYIVIMKADPLVVTEGDNLNTRKAKNRGQQLKQSHNKALRDAGLSTNKIVNQYVSALNGFSARVSYKQALKLAGNPAVAMVLPDELKQPMTDSSPEFLGLTGGAGAYDKGITGEGVVVGVIDTGIWPEHPSFADDGSFSAPPVTIDDVPGFPGCDFGNTAHNPNDAPFDCNNKLIGARQMLETYRALIGADPDEFDSARDDDGHGSHTASTAAGNTGVEAEVYGTPLATISGIAYRAHVVAYKGLGNLGGFTSDLAAAINQAVDDGVDVINYSIGGGAAAPGADEIAFLFAANAGVFAATSAGNSGPGPGTVGNPGTMPWLTTVGANTQSRFFQGTIELGNGAEYTGASITDDTGGPAPLVDAADATPDGDDLCRDDGSLDPTLVTGAIVLCRRGVTARVEKSLAVLNAGGVGMIMYENSDDNNLFTDTHWLPTVHIDQTPGLAIKAYIAAEGAGATAEIRDTRTVSTWPSAPSMTIFSSRGPNAVSPDIIKPDVTAPGIQILAGNSPFPDPGSFSGELFQAIAGTSMSSPHVAGLFALLKQAHPDWSAAAAKSALMTTSYQDVVDNDRTSPANPFAMGAGHVDPGGKVHKGTPFQPGLVYEAGLFEYAAWTCGMDFGVFTPGSCDFLESIGVPSEAVNLNLPSIGIANLAGTETITRTVTSVGAGRRTYNVSVEEPEGYSVTVSPSTITLRNGQSASYQVTIVNESADIDEWEFGSLTWSEKTGHYDAYSPIAVKGVLFAAPEEVSGSGESGSASFEVKFGYTGDYSAAAHGLEPATLTVDNVLQDPNQNFNPSDVATGGANAHTFNLTDVAHFRIAMPPEATEPDADLDIFVYNPANVQVASSTAGGTNELIDIAFPEDGVWTVYVHGWAAPGGDSDYTMYTWEISETPGGSLVIDSAPTEAVLATSGTVEISWTGATAGEWHLGAVSHTMDSLADLGLTLVNVDNR